MERKGQESRTSEELVTNTIVKRFQDDVTLRGELSSRLVEKKMGQERIE